MKLHIHGSGIRPTGVLKRYIQRRISRALRSFDIDRATVRVLRSRGHSRHGTHRCEVALSSPGLSLLLVTARHGSLRVACSRAAAQAEHALERALTESHKPSRADRRQLTLS